jgi:hypothetical protein
MILVYIKNLFLDRFGRARKPGVDVFADIYKQSLELFVLNYC